MSQFSGPQKTSMKKTDSKRDCTIESTNRQTSLFRSARDIGAFSSTRRASNFGHPNGHRVVNTNPTQHQMPHDGLNRVVTPHVDRSQKMLIQNLMIMEAEAEAKAKAKNEEERQEMLKRATTKVLVKLGLRELQHLWMIFEESLINVRARIKAFQKQQVPSLPLIPYIAPGFGCYPYGSYAHGSLGQTLGFGPLGRFDAYGNVPVVGGYPYGLGANGSDDGTSFDIAPGFRRYIYVPRENESLVGALGFHGRKGQFGFGAPRCLDSNGFVDMVSRLRGNPCRSEKNGSNGGAHGFGGSNGDGSNGRNPIFVPPESSNKNGRPAKKNLRLRLTQMALIKMDPMWDLSILKVVPPRIFI